jgi:hypothetical protein
MAVSNCCAATPSLFNSIAVSLWVRYAPIQRDLPLLQRHTPPYNLTTRVTGRPDPIQTVLSACIPVAISVVVVDFVAVVGHYANRPNVQELEPLMSDQDASWHKGPENSGMGTASFVISIIAGILMIVVVTGKGFLGSSTPGGMVEISPDALWTGGPISLLFLLQLVALGLGIAGLCQKGKKKLRAIFGTIFSSATIVVVALLITLGNA